jgi:hypothetical protein
VLYHHFLLCELGYERYPMIPFFSTVGSKRYSRFILKDVLRDSDLKCLVLFKISRLPSHGSRPQGYDEWDRMIAVRS